MLIEKFPLTRFIAPGHSRVFPTKAAIRHPGIYDPTGDAIKKS